MRKCKFDTTLECSLDHVPTKSECIACALRGIAEAFSNEQKEGVEMGAYLGGKSWYITKGSVNREKVF